jgi:Pyruvate/2-oxoacid:ferredoxin oxidoreductase delta subunit
MKRQIIEIDEELCDGCEECIPGCPEGAIQIIDGKARLISDLFCDGLGACIGTCPQGAITVIEREAEPYDEVIVMENIVRQGENTIKAHLKHLRDHGQSDFLKTAVSFLEENEIAVPDFESPESSCASGGCPGSQNMAFVDQIQTPENVATTDVPSALTHWPIQMHLVSPMAPHFAGADLVLAADCVAFSIGNFHQKYLPGKTLAIACPKLDQQQEIYLQKLKVLIDEAKINTLTVMIMQVPCCRGLLMMAQQAQQMADRKIPVKVIVVGIQGEILEDTWIEAAAG